MLPTKGSKLGWLSVKAKLEFGLKLELTAGAVLSVKEKLELGLNGGVAAGAGWLSVKAKLELGLNGGFAAGAGWLSVKAKLELGLKDVFGGLSVKAKPELPEGLKLVAAAGDGVGSKSILAWSRGKKEHGNIRLNSTPLVEGSFRAQGCN